MGLFTSNKASSNNALSNANNISINPIFNTGSGVNLTPENKVYQSQPVTQNPSSGQEDEWKALDTQLKANMAAEGGMIKDDGDMYKTTSDVETETIPYQSVSSPLNAANASGFFAGNTGGALPLIILGVIAGIIFLVKKKSKKKND